MVPQRIEREILIEAPVDVVWDVVTQPEHISRWFSDSVELDLRPGGRALLLLFWRCLLSRLLLRRASDSRHWHLTCSLDSSVGVHEYLTRGSENVHVAHSH